MLSYISIHTSIHTCIYIYELESFVPDVSTILKKMSRVNKIMVIQCKNEKL